MSVNMIWRDDPGAYAGAQSLRWGSVTVGKVQRWETGPMAAWTAKCFLPGVRTTLGHDTSRELARVRVEKAVAEWCEMAGVEA